MLSASSDESRRSVPESVCSTGARCPARMALYYYGNSGFLVGAEREKRNDPLSLLLIVARLSSPSRVRFAAQNRRALDRSGPPEGIHLIGGKGDKRKNRKNP